MSESEQNKTTCAQCSADPVSETLQGRSEPLVQSADDQPKCVHPAPVSVPLGSEADLRSPVGTPITDPEVYKAEGNKAFQSSNFRLAEILYSRAIDLAEKPNAVYFTNRALARFNLGTFGLCIEDATTAISLDPQSSKAYFRRAEAYLALSKLTEAKADYARSLTLRSGDKMITEKLNSVTKKIKDLRFSEAIADHTASPIHCIDPSSMQVPANYHGPVITESSSIDNEVFEEVLKYCRTGKTMPAPCFASLMRRAYDVFSKESTMVKSKVELKEDETPILTIVGDIHGQVYDLAYLLDQIGVPNEGELVVFLGDYVDRRDHGISVIQILLTYKLCAPERVIMLRGNHENADMNRQFGFANEMMKAYRPGFFSAIQDMFSVIPLAALINDRLFCVHGGLPVVSDAPLDMIEKMPRGNSLTPTIEEMLWSDPQEVSGTSNSPRGAGHQYGPDVATKWMEKNGVRVVFRAHQMNETGIREDFALSARAPVGRWHLTVFSAPHYCGEANNGRAVRMNSAQIVAASKGESLHYEQVLLETNPVSDPKARLLPMGQNPMLQRLLQMSGGR